MVSKDWTKIFWVQKDIGPKLNGLSTTLVFKNFG